MATLLPLKDFPVSDSFENNLDTLFLRAQEKFIPPDLEAGTRDELLRASMGKLQKKGKLDLTNLDKAVDEVVKKANKLAKKGRDDLDDEDDEEIDYKNLPAAWKRHSVILSFGTAAAYFSTIPSQTIISVLFTLGFLKLSKSYMIGFPRFRRYCVTAALIGSAIGLKSIWNQVDLTPLAAGLGIDAFAFTAKAYMKGKLKKDEGPQETNRVFLAAQKALSKTNDFIGSCVNKVSSCLSLLKCCSSKSPQVQPS